LAGTAFIRTVNNKIMIGNTILPMFFIFFTQVLLLKTNEYKARKKFKNLQLVGLIKYIKNDLIKKNIVIEQSPESNLIIS